MKKYQWVILMLLALWIAGSSWWYVCKIKHKCGCDNCYAKPITSIKKGDAANYYS